MSEYNEILETVTDYLDLPKNINILIMKYHKKFGIFNEKEKYVYNKILYLNYFKQKAATMIRKIKILRCNAELEYQEMIHQAAIEKRIDERKVKTYNEMIRLTKINKKGYVSIKDIIRPFKMPEPEGEWKTVMVFSVPEGKYVEETGYYLKRKYPLNGCYCCCHT